MAEVLDSSTFTRQFHMLPAADQERVRDGLAALKDDPITPRPGADIAPLKATDPLKHRLRVGDLRIIYVVDGNQVRVIEVFRRSPREHE